LEILLRDNTYGDCDDFGLVQVRVRVDEVNAKFLSTLQLANSCIINGFCTSDFGVGLKLLPLVPRETNAVDTGSIFTNILDVYLHMYSHQLTLAR